jgi:hypothetical protein
MFELKRSSLVALALVGAALLACKKNSSGTAATGSAELAAPETAGVKFQKKVPGVGSKRVESSQNDLDFSIDFKRAGKTIAGGRFKKNEVEKKRIEVTGINATSVTKVRVTYTEKYDEESRGNASPRKKPSPVAGKTYDVDSTGGKIEVTDEHDRPVPKRERDVVAKDWRSLGKPDKMAALIPDHPLVEGEKLPVSQDLVRDLFGSNDGDDTSIDKATFTFRGTKQDGQKTFGQFDVVLKIAMTSKKDDLIMSMDLGGKLSVDTAGSQLVDLTLKGPFTMKGVSRTAQGELEGSGSMNASASSRPE